MVTWAIIERESDRLTFAAVVLTVYVYGIKTIGDWISRYGVRLVSLKLC